MTITAVARATRVAGKIAGDPELRIPDRLVEASVPFAVPMRIANPSAPAIAISSYTNRRLRPCANRINSSRKSDQMISRSYVTSQNHPARFRSCATRLAAAVSAAVGPGA